jgi:hypothetical protein
MKITIHTKPNAREEKVVQLDDHTFSVFVKAPPKEGKANFAVAEALARHFGVSLSCVRFVSGKTSRIKVFDVET